MKLPVVGGMTQAEGNALGANFTSGSMADNLPNVTQGAQGTLLDNGMHLHCCCNFAQVLSALA